MNPNLENYWLSEYVDAHRRGISDLDWAGIQPRGNPKYRIGDIVEFKVGGFGMITEVSREHNGWPTSYATSSIKGMPFHPQTKVAWHYELDIKRKLFWKTLFQYLHL